jgi:hypothetical protein
MVKVTASKHFAELPVLITVQVRLTNGHCKCAAGYGLPHAR